MTLIDLLDLEAQLARDREADPVTLELRDRSLLLGTPRGSGERAALLHRWLTALRQREPQAFFPGRAVSSAIWGLRAVLAFVGLALGWGAATAVLHYTGSDPVNVWDFLLAFVGLQLVLLALLVATFLIPMAAFGAPFVGAIGGLFRAVYPRLAARGGERPEQWRALWHRLGARRSLYHRVEPWVLLGLTQTFGVAFNVGALLGLARLVVFSDIAFCWSTTLVQLDGPRFHALVASLAAPFGWAFPDAVPSLELVEATRFSRLEGAYVLSGTGRAASPELIGGWWPFLTAALVFYGLLPRVVTLGLAQVAAWWTLARLPLDDVEVSRVIHRLAEPHVETRSSTPELSGSLPTPPAVLPKAKGEVPAPGARCAIVLWRDIPSGPALKAALTWSTGGGVTEFHSAGGLDFEEGVEGWHDRLAGAARVALVAEGWEAPDRSVRRLLTELRRSAGPRSPLTVWLVDEAGEVVRPAAAPQLKIWREALGRLEDPYLAVEPLGGAP
jgi:hypothetical protein